MTFDECKKGLGSDKKFFVTSRFAVCDGASFLQTWLQNNRPVGESMFNVRVIGTIPSNSRTINFQYYFTDFITTGRTGAASMPITTKGNIPQSWPSGVRYTRGGNLPAGSKTFAQLKAAGTFNQTVTAAPGQGSSGSTDLIFSVYEPVVTYTAPPPWKLSGSTGRKLALRQRSGLGPAGTADPDTPGAARVRQFDDLVHPARVHRPHRKLSARRAENQPKRACSPPRPPGLAASSCPGPAACRGGPSDASQSWLFVTWHAVRRLRGGGGAPPGSVWASPWRPLFQRAPGPHHVSRPRQGPGRPAVPVSGQPLPARGRRVSAGGGLLGCR